MSKEYAVESGIDPDDVPRPPEFTAQSASEDETRGKISEWRSEVRALGLDPSAALRIVSEDPDADDEPNAEPADAPGDAPRRGWLAAARDAASSVPDGWRPQGLFTENVEDDADTPPGPGVEEYEPRDPEAVNDAILNPDTDADPWADALGAGDPDADAGGVDLDAHRERVRSSVGDYRGKAGPDPRTSSQSARSSFQTGANYVGLESTRSPNARSSASGEDDDRPTGVFTADPEADDE